MPKLDEYLKIAEAVEYLGVYRTPGRRIREIEQEITRCRRR